MSDSIDIAEWFADSKKCADGFLRVMRQRLADPDRPVDEVLYVAYRLIPEDLSQDEIAAMWLVTAAALIDAQAEVERLHVHSTTFNSVMWKIALALGEVPAGADQIKGNPQAQVDRLIAKIPVAVSSEAARELESAAIRRYADRYHSFGASHPGTSGPGEPLDPDAWCVCGASWSEEDGGCTERIALLAEAELVSRAYSAAKA